MIRHIFFASIALAVGLIVIGCDGLGLTVPAGDSLSISGTIASTGTTAKRATAGQSNEQRYTVVAQSASSGKVFLDTVDENGNFELNVPEAETGNLMMVTIIDPNGQPAGPVLFGQSGNEGMAGFDLSRDAKLGTIQMPDDMMTGPIEAGSDGDVGELAAIDVLTRLDDNGVPVGVGSIGKGPDAQGMTTDNPRQACDRDRDGLIDIFDADNDGDGVIDENDSNSPVESAGSDDVRLSFFMNLKIANEDANTYYNGTEAEIEEALKEDTVITLEVVPEPSATRTVASVKALTAPAPTYISDTEVMIDNGSSIMPAAWSSVDYEFDESGERFQAFVIPNALINAGDTFTLEIVYSDGTTETLSRMINYVFKTIPRLRKHGESGSLTAFSGSQPITFDGTKDLTLEFEPPKDETGEYLTGFAYHFEIFYNEANSGNQLNGEIDRNATFSTAIAGFNSQNLVLEVSADSLTLSGDNTYTVTIPKEIFVNSVTTNTSDTKNVASYKIDIAAQSGNGDNSAIMLPFEKM